MHVGDLGGRVPAAELDEEEVAKERVEVPHATCIACSRDKSEFVRATQ
jgi:hypothetical protein